ARNNWSGKSGRRGVEQGSKRAKCQRFSGSLAAQQSLEQMNPDDTHRLRGKRILLIIGGGIAAYKSLALIRPLRERGGEGRVVITQASQEFITPLSAGATPGGPAV